MGGRGEIRVVVRRRVERPRRKRRDERKPTGAVEGSSGIGVASFLPVRVIGTDLHQEASSMVQGPSDRSLEVVVAGGRVIRVPTGFDPGTLAEVIRTLESLGC